MVESPKNNMTASQLTGGIASANVNDAARQRAERESLSASMPARPLRRSVTMNLEATLSDPAALATLTNFAMSNGGARRSKRRSIVGIAPHSATVPRRQSATIAPNSATLPRRHRSNNIHRSNRNALNTDSGGSSSHQRRALAQSGFWTASGNGNHNSGNGNGATSNKKRPYTEVELVSGEVSTPCPRRRSDASLPTSPTQSAPTSARTSTASSPRTGNNSHASGKGARQAELTRSSSSVSSICSISSSAPSSSSRSITPQDSFADLNQMRFGARLSAAAAAAASTTTTTPAKATAKGRKRGSTTSAVVIVEDAPPVDAMFAMDDVPFSPPLRSPPTSARRTSQQPVSPYVAPSSNNKQSLPGRGAGALRRATSVPSWVGLTASGENRKHHQNQHRYKLKQCKQEQGEATAKQEQTEQQCKKRANSSPAVPPPLPLQRTTSASMREAFENNSRSVVCSSSSSSGGDGGRNSNHHTSVPKPLAVPQSNPPPNIIDTPPLLPTVRCTEHANTRAITPATLKQALAGQFIDKSKLLIVDW